jgi:hypothetical protein
MSIRLFYRIPDRRDRFTPEELSAGTDLQEDLRTDRLPSPER